MEFHNPFIAHQDEVHLVVYSMVTSEDGAGFRQDLKGLLYSHSTYPKHDVTYMQII